VAANRVLPVALRIEGQPCLVVGGGPVAFRKIGHLLEAGGVVRVVAPHVVAEIAVLASAGQVEWSARRFVEADLESARLVVTATGNREVDHAVFLSGDARGVWVNSADDRENCHFFLTANVRRDPLVVAVSTGGASPALASYVRRRLEEYLEKELAQLAEVLGRVRDDLHAEGVSTEFLPWSSVVDDLLVSEVVNGNWEAAEARVRSVVQDVPA
jgi:uroporphyrin-III C-methyltransferase/precorrin-2 dehydrogenase/sirohydrochlorin ferrochelatase